MHSYDPDIDFDPESQAAAVARPGIDPIKYQHHIDVLRSKQHLPLGLIGGLVGAAAGIAAWVGITVNTNLQIGWMAIGVGVLAGMGVRVWGRGIDRLFGLAGGVAALLGAAAGNLLSGCYFVAGKVPGATFLDVVTGLTPKLAFDILKDLTTPLDIGFYVIAAIAAYAIGFRPVRRRELARLLVQPGHGS